MEKDIPYEHYAYLQMQTIGEIRTKTILYKRPELPKEDDRTDQIQGNESWDHFL